MSLPRITTVVPGSPADRAGLVVGDYLASIDGERPRDILEYRTLTDAAQLLLEVERDGMGFEVEIDRPAHVPLGVEVHSALFDEIQTCDNHCEFCFIYQLPKGLRKSLYLKDDDFRLSFMFGNYTTLTRFTEADLERVVEERLSPLNVSIHATNPKIRETMLRNRRGASSLRWLRELLDAGIAVHGQVVVCPGVNDGDVLNETLADIADVYRELETVAVVPLGVSKFSTEGRMRAHTQAELDAVIDTVEYWQDLFLRLVGRRMVYAADEYYLAAHRELPGYDIYEGAPMYEDGIGMARTFEAEFSGDLTPEREGGFFSWADSTHTGYSTPSSRTGATDEASDVVSVSLRPSKSAPIAVLTSELASPVLRDMVQTIDPDVRVLPVENQFFGGNVGVAGLLVGEDLNRVLRDQPHGHRYLLPDVCLNGGVFLDGLSPDDLVRPVEVLETDGNVLRRTIERRS